MHVVREKNHHRNLPLLLAQFVWNVIPNLILMFRLATALPWWFHRSHGVPIFMFYVVHPQFSPLLSILLSKFARTALRSRKRVCRFACMSRSFIWSLFLFWPFNRVKVNLRRHNWHGYFQPIGTYQFFVVLDLPYLRVPVLPLSLQRCACEPCTPKFQQFSTIA